LADPARAIRAGARIGPCSGGGFADVRRAGIDGGSIGLLGWRSAQDDRPRRFRGACRASATVPRTTMKVVADLCIVPMGVGPSVSPYVKEIKAIIDASGLDAEMHPNGTNIEGELSDICKLAEQCEARLAELGVQRVFFTLIFSSRRDKAQSMADKLKAVS
jgi:uncharacterized protein (TIGR00106 family)